MDGELWCCSSLLRTTGGGAASGMWLCYVLWPKVLATASARTGEHGQSATTALLLLSGTMLPYRGGNATNEETRCYHQLATVLP